MSHSNWIAKRVWARKQLDRKERARAFKRRDPYSVHGGYRSDPRQPWSNAEADRNLVRALDNWLTKLFG